MSYDVLIGQHYFNVTYNIGQLFRDHLPPKEGRPLDGKDGLPSLDGMTGRQAMHVLSRAFDSLERKRNQLWELNAVGEPALCALYDAPNGWGSTVGGIIFLGQLLAACAAHPRLKVRVK